MQPQTTGAGDALLVVDVLNDFRFEGGDTLFRQFVPCVAPLAHLLARARRRRVPVIYANDNFGRWRSSAEQVAERIRATNARAWRTLEPLHPQPSDYVVLKPRHSAFYATPLELLLEALGVDRLVIAGVSATSCVWFTAADAHVRGYQVVVPPDAIAAQSIGLTRAVLEVLRDALQASTPQARSVRLRAPQRARETDD
jgi:nicotinamidase-related amidase